MNLREAAIKVQINELEAHFSDGSAKWEEIDDRIDPIHSQHRDEWTTYFNENVSLDASDVVQREWVERCFDQYKATYEGDENTDDEIKEYISYMLHLSRLELYYDIQSGLEETLVTFTRLRIAHRMQTPNAEVNVLRQGFLLLMTAFDAAAFDIFRIAMRDHFFQLIPLFSKKESLSVANWGKFVDFEAFRAKMIEHHLKGVYLRDLLFRLQDIGVQSTKNVKDNDKLIEMILRRNLHVHNGGRVDSVYLNTDDDGNHRFNPYKVALGDVAAIDEDYFRNAVKLTQECIELLFAWVDAGSQINHEALKQARKRKVETN